MTIEELKVEFEKLGIKEGDRIACAYYGGNENEAFGIELEGWKWADSEFKDDLLGDRDIVIELDGDVIWLYDGFRNKFATKVEQ